MMTGEKAEVLGASIQAVHFVGIGGTGMSALARIMLDLGFEVTGSDLELSPAAERLSRRGARIYRGHHPCHVQGADSVIYSTAVDGKNPELIEARRKGLPVRHRSDLLARLMELKDGIAVAGSHGKTSTAAMITWMLAEAGLKPAFALGGEVIGLNGNGGWDEGEALVAEADESDGSFQKLSPVREVLTGLDLDHVNYYSGWEKLIEAFRTFIGRLPAGGSLIVQAGTRHLDALLPDGIVAVTYGLSDNASVRAGEIKMDKNGSRFTVEKEGEKIGPVELALLGGCNVENALAAVAIGLEMGLPFSTISAALAAFRGARRRLEVKAGNGIMIVDDYSHHPAEVTAALVALRAVRPRSLWCVFQPHRYSRVAYFARQLAEALMKADHIIMTDLYPAFEKPVPGVSSRLITAELEKLEHKSTVLLRQDAVIERLLAGVKEGDAVVIMGPGDIGRLVGKLLKTVKG